MNSMDEENKNLNIDKFLITICLGLMALIVTNIYLKNKYFSSVVNVGVITMLYLVWFMVLNALKTKVNHKKSLFIFLTGTLASIIFGITSYFWTQTMIVFNLPIMQIILLLTTLCSFILVPSLRKESSLIKVALVQILFSFSWLISYS